MFILSYDASHSAGHFHIQAYVRGSVLVHCNKASHVIFFFFCFPSVHKSSVYTKSITYVVALRIQLQCSGCRRHGFNPWVRKVPWRRIWQPIPVLLPGKSHRQRSLVDYRPWGSRVGHSLAIKQKQFKMWATDQV